MYLIFDTETTGLPASWTAPLDDFDNWPRMIQIAWQIHDVEGKLLDVQNFLIKPDGFIIPRGSEKIHGISTERATREGQPLEDVLNQFLSAISNISCIIGHNIEFDNNIVGSELLRAGKSTDLLFSINALDTKVLSTNYCALPGGKGGNFKWPTLEELHFKLFEEKFDAAHNAMADVQATARCFLELIRLRIIKPMKLKVAEEVIENFIHNNPEQIQSEGMELEPFHEKDEVDEDESDMSVEEQSIVNDDIPFIPLHVHTQFSVLDGLSDIDLMLDKAKKDKMEAVAITDHGYMYGTKKFHDAALKREIKPIIGCEVYVARRGLNKKENKIDGKGWHLVLLAKNIKGYQNLIKMVSIASVEGFYYRPRIDKDLLSKYKDGIIALTACLAGELPDKLINEGEEKAEEALLEYKEMFGDDFYLELQRHPTGNPEMDKKVYDDQVFVNKSLIQLAKKHNLKLVATNDSHFIDADDASAHDRLICIGTAKDLDDPKRMRYTQQEWFKTQSEMRKLFADLPEAISNTKEVADKIEIYELNKAPIMPEFIIPEEFNDADAYLKHITYIGAEKRYESLTEEIKERLDFELNTIAKMGFPDYF